MKVSIFLSILIIFFNINNQDIKIDNTEIDCAEVLSEEVIIIPEVVQIPNYNIKLDKGLQIFIWQQCQKNNFEYEYILALIYQEGRFNNNNKSYNKNGTNDMGLCQINSGKTLFWLASLANIEKPDRSNPEHSILMCMERLKYSREYWIKKGVSEDKLFYYITNSYNMGEGGYKRYINNTSKLSREYDKNITKYKNNLIIKGEIE